MSEISSIRRFHVGGEDYYERRNRERREAKEAEQAARQKQEAKQQQIDLAAQRSASWHDWFLNCFNTNLEPLYEAIGESQAERQHEICDRFDPKIWALEEKNAALEKRIEKLESLLALNNRFEELERGFVARQVAMDQAKKGEKGEPGARGERGHTGPRGEKGDKGDAAEPIYIKSWQIDRARYRASPLYSDGTVGEMLELRPIGEQIFSEVEGWLLLNK